MHPEPYPWSRIEAKWRDRHASDAQPEPDPPSEPGERGDAVPEVPAARRRTPGALSRYQRYLVSWGTRGRDPGWSLVRRLLVADTAARFQRHCGREALFTQVLDGFAAGLVEEAERTRRSVEDVVEDGVAAIEQSLGMLGIETHTPAPPPTSRPAYVALTQWLFLDMLARGNVEHRVRDGHFCDACGRWASKIAGAGNCPACGGLLRERRTSSWWMLAAPFTERLLNDVDKSHWSPEFRKQQKILVGRSRGVELTLSVSRPFDTECEEVTVFTRRIEALFGLTFLLVAPDHDIVDRIVDSAYEDDVERYRARWVRGQEPRVSGAHTGGFALNPANLQRVPIVISPLAIKPYCDGVVLGIPAHDADQFELARRLRLRVREAIHGPGSSLDHESRLLEPYQGDGILTNSGPFSGLPARVGRDKIVTFLGRRGICARATRYLLRGFCLSQDSPWGPPVPVVHCRECGAVPLSVAHLPILPSGIRRVSGPQGADPPAEPAAASCPSCGKDAARDPHTLAAWFSLSWSYVVPLLPPLDEVLGALTARQAPGKAEHPMEKTAGAGEERPVGEEPAGAGEAASETGAREGGEKPDRGDPAGARDTEVRSENESAEPPAPGGDAPETEDAGHAAEGAREGGDGGDSKPRRDARAPDESRAGRLPRLPPKPRPFRGLLAPRLLPVDAVFAGPEVTPKVALATRLVTKFLYDTRNVPIYEPFRRLIRVGSIEAATSGASTQESPEAGNAASGVASAACPRETFERFGSDALRVALLGLGPSARPARFDPRDTRHASRFLGRVWREISLRLERGKFVSRRVLVHKHRLIYQVTDRLRRMKYHTALSAVREFVSFLLSPETTDEEMDRSAIETFLILLAPFAPCLARELWEKTGSPAPLEDARWPAYSAELVDPPEREFAIIIEGRVRDRMEQPSNLEPEKLQSRALQRERVGRYIGRRKIRRVVVVPRSLVHVSLEDDTPPAQASEPPGTPPAE